MKIFHTFRARLLFILAILLVATLGVQYFLNLQTERRNEDLREMQTQALVAGIALGVNSISSDARLQDLVDPGSSQSFFDERTTKSIRDILVIDNEWQIYDSLSDKYLPVRDESDEMRYKDLKDLTDLPPLIDADRLGSDREKFPNAQKAVTDQDETEAHVIPIETNQGRWYVMVILASDKREAAQRAAQPLIYTLGILSISTLITILLVWRFTRPIANLSVAARRVAEGDLCVRVPDSERGDEIGQLASRFNEMTAQLEKKRELEMQLQQAEKSAVVGRLGSAIAHEIRNPLNYINLTLDHLRAKFAPEGDEEREADFEKLTSQLKKEVARINQQISDFLSYSRPPKLNMQEIDLHRVVKYSLRIVEGQAAEQNIKISLVEEENVPAVRGDAEVLRSVFNNLFINAVQAMETAGGSLSVKMSPEDGTAKIEVTDTGTGISEENLPKIFEPYFSTKETGTGLGLAIVKKIVDVHNGTIDVESNLNEGTKFIVKLPKARN